MKASISHNLSETELIKALSALAEQSDIGEELLKAVKARTCACDDTPKEPRFPATRELYRMLQGEFAKAAADIERYAEGIIKMEWPTV